MEHPDSRVREAINELVYDLCMWERATGRSSILIIREQGGFAYRSYCGKPTVPDSMTDADALALIGKRPDLHVTK